MRAKLSLAARCLRSRRRTRDGAGHGNAPGCRVTEVWANSHLAWCPWGEWSDWGPGHVGSPPAPAPFPGNGNAPGSGSGSGSGSGTGTGTGTGSVIRIGTQHSVNRNRTLAPVPAHIPAASLTSPPHAPFTHTPSNTPTKAPTLRPSDVPTTLPTKTPTDAPRFPQTHLPTQIPTRSPTAPPTKLPTVTPTDALVTMRGACHLLAAAVLHSGATAG